MIFTIESEFHLATLDTALKEHKFNVEIKNEFELSVMVENERRKALLERVLSFFISYILFFKTVKESLQRTQLREEDREKFLKEGIHYFTTCSYWKGLTLVLVSEYLLNSTHLNIDSFMLFNMKGFKTEVQQYIATCDNECVGLIP